MIATKKMFFMEFNLKLFHEFPDTHTHTYIYIYIYYYVDINKREK